MARVGSVRWSVFGSIFTAVRRATRPGSASMSDRFAAMPRLVCASLRGEYSLTRPADLLLLLGAVVYVISPVDLLPEAVLGPFGLGDDVLVITWIAAWLVNHTEDFLAWEHGRHTVVDGEVVGASH